MSERDWDRPLAVSREISEEYFPSSPPPPQAPARRHGAVLATVGVLIALGCLAGKHAVVWGGHGTHTVPTEQHEKNLDSEHVPASERRGAVSAGADLLGRGIRLLEKATEGEDESAEHARIVLRRSAKALEKWR